MTFTRVQEDFTCGHCAAAVEGDGYTNHCPQCLWSRHVDVEPGDRAATCGGMMEPIALEGSTPDYSIIHVCTVCGYTKRNKAQRADDEAALIALADRRRS